MLTFQKGLRFPKPFLISRRDRARQAESTTVSTDGEQMRNPKEEGVYSVVELYDRLSPSEPRFPRRTTL